ncbi:MULTISPECIES: hypothetical protein [Lactobacillus]|uniref:Uncharacterized protein n=1 Tax=Lactobacillus xujianguonis TaxID=2495899 RepID=A0A437SU24_9LACO|nr:MULTISPECIES: hypothetical protein [Lactobacillus]RVU70438.1 hypothetical protein EJK17_07515 [Lactobacillus xujianguonis]RVU73290.1 hypothetical protein EJK20_08995 [Lactobacillus xujianguonis]
MNPDFAIILSFQIKHPDSTNADQLVKTARDIGVRAVSGSDLLKDACQKYTISLAEPTDGLDLTSDNVIDTLVTRREQGKSTVINIPVAADGKFSEETVALFDTINHWMHMFGHALNDGEVSKLTVDHDGFVLVNRHADYQKYVFLKQPLPEQIVVTGLEQEPNRVEWIENRKDLDFNFENGKLTIQVTAPDDSFPWQVLRIQAHRPEDDLAETKF